MTDSYRACSLGKQETRELCPRPGPTGDALEIERKALGTIFALSRTLNMMRLEALYAIRLEVNVMSVPNICTQRVTRHIPCPMQGEIMLPCIESQQST